LDFRPNSTVFLASPGEGNLGMVHACGDVAVTNHVNPRFGWAVVVLSAATLALGACGRKGGLDLPPTANTPTASAVAPASADTEAEAASRPTVFNPSYGTDAAPIAPKGAKKPFILDPLLAN
jgi:predicted small lipoprotein YifL